MMAVWFYVLVVISDSPYLKPGAEVVGDKAHYSEQSCVDSARLIAQALYVKEGTKYGFRCKKVEYDPPRLDGAK